MEVVTWTAILLALGHIVNVKNVRKLLNISLPMAAHLTDGLDCCDSDCSILVLNNWSSQNVPVLLKYDGNSNLHFKNYRSRAF